MRNLKRALSLTLASVMLLGMMVLGTSAASYPDVTDEHNVEAIEVLQAVGVMSGSNSGNFNPDSQVTRIEMAIVMSNLLNLKVDYFEDQCKFTDVPAWAGKYVAACEANGIVSGIGNNQFGTGNVTATQAALMMLKALGYFQYASDFNGGWDRATAKLAADLSLFAGMDVGNNTALTRNQVAQLALNTLEATMVTPQDNTIHITTGADAGNVDITGGSVQYVVRVATTNKIGTAIRQNDATGNAGVQLNGHTLELGEQLYQGDLVKRDNAAISDEFSRPGTEWRYKGEKIGVYNDEPDASYTKRVSVGQIYKDLGLNRTIPTNRVSLYIDGLEETTAGGKLDNVNPIKNGDDTNKFGGNGVLTQVFYDQDTDSVTITEINTWTGEVVRNVAASGSRDAYLLITPDSARKPSVTGNLEFDTDATYANDTRVLYTYSEKDREVVSVTEAQSVSGIVDKTENTNTDDADRQALTLDGTRYAASAKSTGETVGKVIVKAEYTIYLDSYGYMIYVEESDIAIGNYALLITTADTNAFIGNRARLLLSDGTIKNVETEKNYNGVIADYTIVTFRADDDDVYTLTAVDGAKSFSNKGAAVTGTYGHLDATDDYVSGARKFAMTNNKAGITVDTAVKSYKNNFAAAGVGTYNANSATAFVVADAGVDGTGDDFTAYTGIKNAPTLAAGAAADQGVAAFWYCKSGAMITVMFVFPEGGITVEDGSSNLVYIAKKSVGNLISDRTIGEYYEYDAIVGKEIVESQKVDGKVMINSDSTHAAFNYTAAGYGTAIETDSTANTKDTLTGLFKSANVNKHGVITNLKSYTVGYNASADTEQILYGTSIDKNSKEYTLILGADKKVITVAASPAIWYVDKDGNISEWSYGAISPDANDTFWAVIKDYMVQTLIIEEVASDPNAYDVIFSGDVANVTKADNTALANITNVARGDSASFTVKAKAGYTVESVTVNGLPLTAVNGVYTIDNIRDDVIVVITTAGAGEVMNITVNQRLYGTDGKFEYSTVKNLTVKKSDFVNNQYTVIVQAPTNYLLRGTAQTVTWNANGATLDYLYDAQSGSGAAGSDQPGHDPEPGAALTYDQTYSAAGITITKDTSNGITEYTISGTEAALLAHLNTTPRKECHNDSLIISTGSDPAVANTIAAAGIQFTSPKVNDAYATLANATLTKASDGTVTHPGTQYDSGSHHAWLWFTVGKRDATTDPWTASVRNDRYTAVITWTIGGQPVEESFVINVVVTGA